MPQKGKEPQAVYPLRLPPWRPPSTAAPSGSASAQSAGCEITRGGWRIAEQSIYDAGLRGAQSDVISGKVSCAAGPARSDGKLRRSSPPVPSYNNKRAVRNYCTPLPARSQTTRQASDRYRQWSQTKMIADHLQGINEFEADLWEITDGRNGYVRSGRRSLDSRVAK
jgi:hypothetical protein